MTITGTYEGTQNEMKPYTLQSKKVKKKKKIYPMSRIQHFVKKKNKKKNTMLLGNFKGPLVTIENKA